MTKTYHKTTTNYSLQDFLKNAKAVTSFASSNGKRYHVTGFEGNVMHFKRLDANEDLDWQMNLKEVFRAYQELEEFATINFKVV
jgi:hypothetical protein